MNTIEAIRVLIVDDESLVRGVLKQILSQYPDIEVVGDAEPAMKPSNWSIESSLTLS